MQDQEACSPATAAPIHEILGCLTTNMSQLENATEGLSNRLMIVRPALVEGPPESKQPPAPVRGSSSVAQDLSSLNERIESLGDLVRRILDEIEI